MRVGEVAERASILHVTNGESAANTLRRTALGGALLPRQDDRAVGRIADAHLVRLGEQ